MSDTAASDSRWYLAIALLLIVPLVTLAISLIDKTGEDELAYGCDTLIKHYEAIDAQASLQANAILVLGDSRVTRWRDIPERIAGLPVLARGMPGLTIARVADCFERAVAYYQPQMVLLWLSDTVLDGPVSHVTNNLATLRERANYYSVSHTLIIAPPLETPAMGPDTVKVKRFSAALSGWAGIAPGVSIIDISAPLRGDDGRPNPDFFWPDGRTLFEHGYHAINRWLESHVLTGNG